MYRSQLGKILKNISIKIYQIYVCLKKIFYGHTYNLQWIEKHFPITLHISDWIIHYTFWTESKRIKWQKFYFNFVAFFQFSPLYIFMHNIKTRTISIIKRLPQRPFNPYTYSTPRIVEKPHATSFKPAAVVNKIHHPPCRP